MGMKKETKEETLHNAQTWFFNTRPKEETRGNEGNPIFQVISDQRTTLSHVRDTNLFDDLGAAVKDTSEQRTDRMCLIDPFYCDGHNKFMEENRR